MKNKILSFTFLCLAHFCNAQVLSLFSDAFLWESNVLHNTTNRETLNHFSRFTTAGDSIVWQQLNGASTYVFRILSYEGEWSDLNSDGSVAFLVKKGSLHGRLTFLRQNGRVTVSMEFMKGVVNVMPYVFTVSSVNKL